MVGWTSPSVLLEMADTLHRLQPDVVAFAGNLTTSGTGTEFKNAKELLESFPSPQVIVPGDRDQSSTRWLAGTGSFHKIVESQTTPHFIDREIAVIGVESTSSRGVLSIKDSDRKEVERLLSTTEPGAIKILVSHHRVFYGDRFEPSEADDRVFRSAFDVQLIGPLEPTHAVQGARPSDTTIFVPCANRPEGIAFNLLRIQPPEVVVERYGWQQETASYKLLETNTLVKP